MDVRTVFRVLAVSLLLLIPLGIYFIPEVVATVATWAMWLAPLWLPPLLAFILFPIWLTQVRSQYASSIPYTILELKPGEHTPKTARVMELIFYSLYHRVSISRKMEFLMGQMRMPWSFEIAATNGTVRFFIRVPKSQRQAIEQRIRSEYQDVDIDEPRDYAREAHFDPLTTRLEMREYSFQKPDPYPLKTYEGYESEKVPTPFSALLDSLVGVSEGEYFFISYIVRPHQRERKRFWQDEVDTLHSDASAEIARIIGSAGDPRQLPKQEQQIIAAIEEALKKPSFDCGIRALYIAPRGVFNEERARQLDVLFEKYENSFYNGFSSYKPHMRVMWPLSDIFSALPWFRDSYMFNLYRRRAYFTPPYFGKPIVLNTAELASLFHLPHVSRSSALSRARGTRLEPPENLPV